MAETKRLGPWGWFVRAFAAGFGATFGVVVASVLAIAACYALIAAGVLAFTSLGGVDSQTSGTSTPPTLAPTTTLAPAYPTTVEPSPYVAGPYAGSNPYPTDGGPSYAAPYGNSTTGEPATYGNSTTGEPATNGSSPTGEASNEPPIFNAQPAPPVISVPSEPAPAPEGSSAPLP